MIRRWDLHLSFSADSSYRRLLMLPTVRVNLQGTDSRKFFAAVLVIGSAEQIRSFANTAPGWLTWRQVSDAIATEGTHFSNEMLQTYPM